MKTISRLSAALALVALVAGGLTAQTEAAREAAVSLTTEEFKKRVYDYEAHPDTFMYQGTLPAIVDFHATWCGPCKALAPMLEELAREYAGRVEFYKVDVDQCEALARLFGIRSVPTLLFIPAGGGHPRMQAGTPSRDKLRQIVEGMAR